MTDGGLDYTFECIGNIHTMVSLIVLNFVCFPNLKRCSEETVNIRFNLASSSISTLRLQSCLFNDPKLFRASFQLSAKIE